MVQHICESATAEFAEAQETFWIARTVAMPLLELNAAGDLQCIRKSCLVSRGCIQWEVSKGAACEAGSGQKVAMLHKLYGQSKCKLSIT